MNLMNFAYGDNLATEIVFSPFEKLELGVPPSNRAS